MRTSRCTLVGGPFCGDTWHIPEGSPEVCIIPEENPLAREYYVRTRMRDFDNRQIYQIRARRTYPLPKQHNFPES